MKREYGKYLKVAVEAASAAGAIQKRRLGGSLDIRHKGEADLVTKVDLKCEKVIKGIILEHFPGHEILAEESGGSAGAKYRWLVDPLDGTTNYAHAYPLFCASVALELEGRVVAGAVFSPVTNEMFTATRGGGAFLNGKKIRVSKVNKIGDAMLATGFPYNKKERMGKGLKLFNKMILPVQAIRRDGAAAMDLCYTAMGRFDGFWELLLHPWDIAAGWLIVEEAGGKVTRVSGEPMIMDSPDILASNGTIHHQMIDILNN